MMNHEKDEQKGNESDSSDDDQYQEAIVTGGDGRRKVDVFQPKNDDIYSCIGQLDIEFDYDDENEYKAYKHGTGTVVCLGNSHKKDMKTVYILTCAHNVRLSVIQCTKNHCNTFRRGKNTACKVCGAKDRKFQQKIWITPTKIIFRDRSIKLNNYGETLNSYECKEIYVPDERYRDMWKPKQGFDWAYLAFYDNGVYEARLRAVAFDLVDGCNLFSDKLRISGKTFGIFGYPDDKKDIMVGMTSNKSNRFILATNKTTKQNYLYQRAIDTKGGQSGSLIWYKQQGTINVCGIHVGGKERTQQERAYNIGTLIDPEIMEVFKQIKKGNTMIGIKVHIGVIGVKFIKCTVGWDDKKIDGDYQDKDVAVRVQTKKNNDIMFVDKKIKFRGNGKYMDVNNLEDNTMYSLRVKCFVKDSDVKDNDEQFDDAWWSNATILATKTKKIHSKITVINHNNVKYIMRKINLNSQIITNNKDLCLFIDMLRRRLNSTNFGTHLLYRSTNRDQDKDAAAFHHACDGKGATMTIIQNSSKQIFGGYTDIPWEAVVGRTRGLGRYVHDPKALLFFLDRSKGLIVYENTSHRLGVEHNAVYGPCFGQGEIVIGGIKITYCRAFIDAFCIQENELSDSKGFETVGFEQRSKFEYISYEVFLVK
eukprot:9001_1